jgi:hypothetical protein
MDLSPYTCVAESCPTPYRLFVTQQDWNDHILNDHPPHWQCPCCEGEPPRFERLSEITTHIISKHPLAAHENLENLLSDATIIVMGIITCPLCDFDGAEDSPDLIEHVLQHVHDFSLRSLPWAIDPAISLNKPVGTFDMDYAAKVTSDNEGTEYNLNIAEWVENTDHKYGVPKDDRYNSRLESDEHALDYVALEEEATPSLQLCDFDLNPPRDSEEESITAQTKEDYFSQHFYFKEASSDGRFSSRTSQSSQNTKAETRSSRTLQTKRWMCTLCSTFSTEGEGDESYFRHLEKDHSGEMSQDLIYFDNDKEQWMCSMLSEAHWNAVCVMLAS